MSANEVVLRRVRPFGGRVAVIESGVDEEQSRSGLVLPLSFDGDDGLKRGVVVEAGVSAMFPDCGQLDPGVVVYYRRGVRIRDVVVVDLPDIVAFEDPD